METQKEYTVNRPNIVPSRQIACKCGRVLAREILVSWYNHRRQRMIDANMLVIEMGGITTKAYVRAEIECRCGEKVVWRG